jgi:O-antigen/teichoic acid export membrane protein
MSLVGAGALFRGIGSLFRTVSVVGSTVMLVRMLDRSSYGLFALGFAAVGLVAAFTTLGLGPATTRTLAADLAQGESDEADTVVRGLEAWTIAGGVFGLSVLVILVVLTQSQLPLVQRLIVGFGMGGMLFGRNAAVAAEALARGFSRVSWMEVPNAIGSALQFGLLAALFFSGGGTVISVALTFGLVGVCTVTISAWVALHIGVRKRGPSRSYRASATHLAKLAAPYALAGMAGLVAVNLDILVLGLTHSNSAVGSYEPAMRTIGRVIALVPLLLVVAFIPAATTLFTRGHHRAYADLYLAASKLSFIVTLPLILLLAIFPATILGAVFGAGFQVQPKIVWILLAGSAVELAFGLNRSALIASGDRRRLLHASYWSLATGILLAGVLIPLFGAFGAALAAFGSAAALNMTMSWALYKSTGAHPFHRDFMIVVLTSPAPLALGLVFRSTLGANNVSTAALVAAGSWTIWIVVLRLLSAVRLSDARQLLPRPYLRSG